MMNSSDQGAWGDDSGTGGGWNQKPKPSPNQTPAPTQQQFGNQPQQSNSATGFLAGLSNEFLEKVSKVFNVVSAVLVVATGVLAFLGSLTSFDFEHIGQIFVSLYCMFFGAILLSYEVSCMRNATAKKYFGFIYNVNGRMIFILFLASVSFGIAHVFTPTDDNAGSPAVSGVAYASGAWAAFIICWHLALACFHPSYGSDDDDDSDDVETGGRPQNNFNQTYNAPTSTMASVPPLAPRPNIPQQQQQQQQQQAPPQQVEKPKVDTSENPFSGDGANPFGGDVSTSSASTSSNVDNSANPFASGGF
eukprot:g1528.t1